MKGLKTSELVLREGCLVFLFVYAMEMNRKRAGATSEVSVFLFHCGKRYRMRVRELGDISGQTKEGHHPLALFSTTGTAL